MAYLEYITKCAGVPSGDALTEQLGHLRDNNNMAKVGSEYSPTIQSLLKIGSDDMYQLGRLTALCKYAGISNYQKVVGFISPAERQAVNVLTDKYRTAKTQFKTYETAFNNATQEHASKQQALDNFLKKFNGKAPSQKNKKAFTTYQQLKGDLDKATTARDAADVNYQFGKKEWDAVNNKDYLGQIQQAHHSMMDNAHDAYYADAHPIMHKVKHFFGGNQPIGMPQKKPGIMTNVKGYLDKWVDSKVADAEARRTIKTEQEKQRLKAEQERDDWELEEVKKDNERQREMADKQFAMQMNLYEQMPKWVGGGLALAGIGGPLMYNMTRSNQPQIMYMPPMPAPMPYPAQPYHQ